MMVYKTHGLPCGYAVGKPCVDVESSDRVGCRSQNSMGSNESAGSWGLADSALTMFRSMAA